MNVESHRSAGKVKVHAQDHGWFTVLHLSREDEPGTINLFLNTPEELSVLGAEILDTYKRCRLDRTHYELKQEQEND